MKTLVLILAFAACRPDVDPAGRGEARRIDAEPISTRGALDFDPSQLPPGTRGKFPAFDGDSFAVTIPRRSTDETPREMFDEVIAPLMRGMGFGARVESMSIPRKGFVFQQRQASVPIEHAAVIATPTSVQGTLFNRYRVTNAVKLPPDGAVPPGLEASSRVELVLLPHGSAADGSIALRYAYRALVKERSEPARTWMAWIDADSGQVLQLTPQFEE